MKTTYLNNFMFANYIIYVTICNLFIINTLGHEKSENYKDL